jgi:hypothetical protein
MADNILKKEFKHKDVQRLRNLVQGKYGEKDTVGIGYTKVQEFHNEGDIWDADDQIWTIKDGIKQNITRMDKAKETIFFPLFCKECNTLMKHKYDKIFHLQFKRCYNCQIEFETEIRRQGLWNEYEKNIINKDIDGIIADFNIWMDEEINDNNQSWITEAGVVEEWVGTSTPQMSQERDRIIEFLQSKKK